MDSDPIYPTSSPVAVDATQIPFPKPFQFYDIDGTDDEAFRDEVPPSGNTGKSRMPYSRPVLR